MDTTCLPILQICITVLTPTLSPLFTYFVDWQGESHLPILQALNVAWNKYLNLSMLSKRISNSLKFWWNNFICVIQIIRWTNFAFSCTSMKQVYLLTWKFRVRLLMNECIITIAKVVDFNLKNQLFTLLRFVIDINEKK
jgi:hypothetical protein